MRLWILMLSLFAAGPALAQSEACTLPGALVVEDALNDSGVASEAAAGTGDQDFLDIETLHVAEPADQPGKMVFTLKMRGLSQTPPGIRWAVQFTGPATPAATDEGWFVEMTTLPPDQAAPGVEPQFRYGTSGITSLVATSLRTYTALGDLAEGSGYSADGTITLVLDKSVIGNPAAGEFFDPVFPVVRTITTPNGNAFDWGANGFYETAGDSCGKSAATSLAGAAGALSPFALLMLLLPALRRR